MIDRKPPHEALANFIKDECDSDEFGAVARLIVTTKFEAGFDELAAAIEAASKRENFDADLVAEVLRDLELQKREAVISLRERAAREQLRCREEHGGTAPLIPFG